MKASVPVSRPQIRTFAQAADLDRALCQFVSESLEQAIELRGKTTLVVSGGSTPLGFLRLLAQQQLPWSQVLVTLADERWVPVQHADSNERMVREQLIDHTGAQFFYPCGVLSRLVLRRSGGYRNKCWAMISLTLSYLAWAPTVIRRRYFRKRQILQRYWMRRIQIVVQ